jgi:hypothetical protein
VKKGFEFFVNVSLHALQFILWSNHYYTCFFLQQCRAVVLLLLSIPGQIHLRIWILESFSARALYYMCDLSLFISMEEFFYSSSMDELISKFILFYTIIHFMFFIKKSNAFFPSKMEELIEFELSSHNKTRMEGVPL